VYTGYKEKLPNQTLKMRECEQYECGTDRNGSHVARALFWSILDYVVQYQKDGKMNAKGLGIASIFARLWLKERNVLSTEETTVM